MAISSEKKQQLGHSQKLYAEMLRQRVSDHNTKIHIDNFDFDFQGKGYNVEGYTIWLNIKFPSDGLPYEICRGMNKVYEDAISFVESIQIAVNGKVVPRKNNPHSEKFKTGAFLGRLSFKIDTEEVEMELSLFASYDLD